MTEHSGAIVRGTPRERAILIAGVLAELGVLRIYLQRDGTGGPVGAVGTWLESRKTDLPAVLCQLATWRAEAGAVRLRGSSEAIVWETSDASAAAALGAAAHSDAANAPGDAKP